MTSPRKAAMVTAGLGSAVFVVFADTLFLNSAMSFLERVAVFAILGFFVGVVCFIYGESSVKRL